MHSRGAARPILQRKRHFTEWWLNKSETLSVEQRRNILATMAKRQKDRRERIRDRRQENGDSN